MWHVPGESGDVESGDALSAHIFLMEGELFYYQKIILPYISYWANKKYIYIYQVPQKNAF